MSDKLTKRQQKSLKKAFEQKERRAELKERKRQRAAERAQRRSKPARRRDWLADETYEAEEPVGRGRPRKPAPEAPPPHVEPNATVIEVRSGDSLVSCDGRIVRAVLPPGGRVLDPITRSPLAVGDRVRIQPEGDVARIAGVAPRRSWLSRDVFDPTRRDPVHRAHVLAANIDQVMIVCSPAEPPFRPRLLDRYLVAASRDGLRTVICLNKTDLGVPEDVERLLRGYAGLRIDVLRMSAATGDGIEVLRRAVEGKVSLFSGHSGVGKSSLLNAVEPGLALRVGGVTRSTAGQGKGRHTTSSARLAPLSMPETFVVDTPGIRSFGLRSMAPRELAQHFADIAALSEGCAYRDCLHRGEPGCAVDVEAHHDWFLRERLQSYRALLAEL